MTPTSQPFPRALFHPSRCAAPLRGRLPQRTGKGLRASSGEVVRLYRGQPNTTMPHKTLPLSSLDQNVPNMPGIVQTTPSQKPSSSQRTILFEFDKTCVFGRKVQSRGFHLKLIRLPVQNTRPPQTLGKISLENCVLKVRRIKPPVEPSGVPSGHNPFPDLNPGIYPGLLCYMPSACYGDFEVIVRI